jgi:hypothetical protein
MDVTPFLPFIDNAGASVLFIIFLVISWKRTQLDHVRTLERDRANDETVRFLMLALLECAKSGVQK